MTILGPRNAKDGASPRIPQADSGAACSLGESKGTSEAPVELWRSASGKDKEKEKEGGPHRVSSVDLERLPLGGSAAGQLPGAERLW